MDYFDCFFFYAQLSFSEKSIDRVYFLCYFYTTTNVAMIIVATIDVALPVVERSDYFMSSISSDIIRGYNDTMILYLLWDSPSYGYEISKQIKSLSEEKYVIKETTLYSAFTRLEKNGFVESFSENVTISGKRRTYYRITDQGRQYYREKCAEWTLTKEVVEKFIKEGV